jgi:cytochrome bd ubiquinol oxidase subunit I
LGADRQIGGPVFTLVLVLSRSSMIDMDVVTLSRLQFALTALYHFLFVPLTLGLSMLLVIMESVYVMTGREIWKRITRFWGLLFGINFAMGVATGITMEFQFGTNWAYYSHYVGDIFGAPLAIEGLMAFFLESTFVGLFFFGWDRLSKLGHLVVTGLVALGSSLSAVWILIANGWMQNPVGAHFNYHTMRMELSSFSAVILNPVAQAKFVHTVAAGYVLGSVFVLAISAWYLLRGRNVDVAKRSMAVAASFGLACSLSVVVLGDESGYVASENQKMKVAAIEAEWHTESPPAGFALFGLPDVATRSTHAEIKIPWLLGLIATRSTDRPVEGIVNLVDQDRQRIVSGVEAYATLQQLRALPPAVQPDPEVLARFEAHEADLGYGLLLMRYTDDPALASAQQINAAAWSTVPNVPVLFWSFRCMVALGLYFIFLFATAFYLSTRHRFEKNPWFLKLAFFSLPLPWIAIELGWIVAEYGRQPWAVDGVLPTFLGVSRTSAGNVWLSLLGFVVFYTSLAAVDAFLMVRTIRRGPDGLGYWPVPPAAPGTSDEASHAGL